MKYIINKLIEKYNNKKISFYVFFNELFESIHQCHLQNLSRDN